MKIKVVVLGLFVIGAFTLSKIISIPADPPKRSSFKTADFSPHPGLPPVIIKPPLILAAKTKGEKRGGAASSG